MSKRHPRIELDALLGAFKTNHWDAGVFLIPEIDCSAAYIEKDEPMAPLWAQFGLMLNKLGWIEDSDFNSVIHDFDPVQNGVMRSLNRKYAQYVDGQTMHVDLNLSFNTRSELDYNYGQFEFQHQSERVYDAYTKQCEAKQHPPTDLLELRLIGYRTLSCNVLSVSRKIEQLEAAYPGLGVTAMRLIDLASERVMPLYSPSQVDDIAAHACWYGYDDEIQYLLETEMGQPVILEKIGAIKDAKERHDALYQAIEDGLDLDESLPFTQHQINQAMPPMSLGVGRFIRERELNNLMNNSSSLFSENEKNIIKLLVSIKILLNKNAHLPTHQDTLTRPLILSWSNTFPNTQTHIVDNFFEYESQCDYSDLIGLSYIPFCVENICQTFQCLENGLALFSALDHLISLIGEEIDV